MRDVGLLISLQALLARRALLNANISLNNNPPSFLEAVILSQTIHGIDLLSKLADHQNFHIAFVISLIRALDNKKQDIV